MDQAGHLSEGSTVHMEQSVYVRTIVNAVRHAVSMVSHGSDWPAGGLPISVLIAKGSDVRAELVDAVGPRAELDYWQSRAAALSVVKSQIMHQSIAECLAFLREHSHPLMAQWDALITRVRDADGEARDNVKFLKRLESHLDILGSGTLLEIVDTLPNLLSCIQMMRILARFYSTTERMTVLLVSLSCAIMVSCRCAVIQSAGVGSLLTIGSSRRMPHSKSFLESVRRQDGGVDMLYTISREKGGKTMAVVPSANLLVVSRRLGAISSERFAAHGGRWGGRGSVWAAASFRG